MVPVRSTAAMVLTLVMAMSLAACSSGTNETGESGTEQTGTQTTDTASTVTSSTKPKAALVITEIDPCGLLTQTDGEALVGAGAQQNTYGSAHRCEYENPQTYATVSVGVAQYEPTLTLYGEEVTDTSADRALWASSSSQLILVEGQALFTIMVMPASGDYLAFAKQAAVMVLANYAAMD